MAPAETGRPELASPGEVSEFREWRMIARAVRPTEWLLVTYFCYVALRGLLAGRPAGAAALQCGLTAAGAALLLLLARAEHRSGSLFVSVVRDWLPAPLLLVAYWAVDWPGSQAYETHLEQAWLRFDKVFLHDWGAKAAIEYFGPLLPFLLEFCYSLLYAVPTLSIGVLYLCRRRARVDHFLFTLLLGALITYTLLPLTPSRSPYAAFPGQDLPSFMTPFRQLNFWLLERGDIRTSVFPSGHVTVGFSAAFAMLLALPERKRTGIAIAAIAAGVAVVTVYGRYHYAADGLAAFAVSLLAYAGGTFLYPARQRVSPGRERR